MTIHIPTKPDRLHLVAPVVFLLACAPNIASFAQGLDAEETIKAIVGADVEMTEEAVAVDESRVIEAIENSLDNATEIRKRFSIDNVKIVFLPDFKQEGEATAATAAVKAKMEEFSAEITALREAIHSSAIFFHAIDSRAVVLDDVVGVQFDKNNDVVILVAGRQP